jgi:hypothetical protein
MKLQTSKIKTNTVTKNTLKIKYNALINNKK